MNKVICLYDGCCANYDERSIYLGLGGSESWIVYISEALARISNTHILIYCNCNDWHIHSKYKNIEYLPHNYFYNRSEYQHYDALIISRIIDEDAIEIIKNTKCCNNIYIISHDICIRYFNKEFINEFFYKDLINDEWLTKSIKKIFCLSKWHKQYLIDYYGFPDNLLEITKYGLNEDLLNINKNVKRDNNIFWSNRIERNFNLLVENIAPLIIKEIPDFKIYCAFYDEIPDEYKYLLDYEYVINLGKLGKQQLYEEMSKHKCYFYPSLFAETFCMTCIEHIMCDVQLIMPLRYGPETIFEPYKYLFMNQIWFENENDIEYAASKIIEAMNTYYNPDKIVLRQSIKEYLINEYNWDCIAQELYKKMMIFYK